MLGDVQGDHLDATLRLGHRLPVGVPAAYFLPNAVGLFLEHGGEEVVQRRRPLDGQLRQAGLVPDGDCGAVLHRLRDGVGVDERAEALHGAAAEALVHGGAGEADHHRVGQGPGHQAAQHAVLGAVRLVDHDEDVAGVAEHVQLAVGRGQRLLELLDGGHHRAASSLLEDRLQVEGLGSAGTFPAAAGAAFLRRRPGSELGGDDELVESAVGAFEVEEADVAGVLSVGGVNGQGQAERQVLVELLVAGDADLVDVLQFEDDSLRLFLGQPFVETQQGGPQPPHQQDLALPAPLPPPAPRRARKSTPAAPAEHEPALRLGCIR